MGSRSLCVAVALLAIASSGCGDDLGPVYADGATRDSGSMDGDLGARDGGVFDGATGMDGGGTLMDAGDVDAAPSDAGATGVDAEPMDGSSDAGRVSMPCTAMGACDPFATTSCPMGQLCQPQLDGGTACVAGAATPLPEGATCTFGTECGPGTLCLNFGDGFKCQRMCPTGSIGACTGETRCFGTIGDVCIRICRPRAAPCDIYMQDCPDPLDTCTLATDPETDARYTGCRPAGMQGHLAPCGGGAGSCGHGLICINEGGDSGGARCRNVCGADGGTPACPAGELCTGFARSWMVTYCQ